MGFLFVLGMPFLSSALASNLPNLRAPSAPRFPITDRVWPANPGEASICLWKDDKLAAFSTGIDDNCAGDIDWWLEVAAQYQVPITWWVIVGGPPSTVGGIGVNNGRIANYGHWSQWQKVIDAGHAVESHSMTHLEFANPANPTNPAWLGTEWEYSESKSRIEANLPGWRVMTLAYPGGAGQETNDPNLAAKYYVAGRHGVPSPNPANTIDYLRVNAASQPYFAAIGTNASRDFQNMNNVLQRTAHQPNQYRGWAIGFFHFIGTDPVRRKGVTDLLSWYQSNSQNLWAGLFRDVARYGQQRDTATLNVTENTPNRISFTLSDQMDDRVFDYPLTVKVRLPSAWSQVSAEQNGTVVNARVVENNGARFALVDAVPDRGQVVLRAGQSVTTSYGQWIGDHFSLSERSNPAIAGPTADPDRDGMPNLLEYAIASSPVDNLPTADRPYVENVSDRLQIRFRVDTSRADLTYNVEASSDLANWSTLARGVGGGKVLGVDSAVGPIDDSGLGSRVVTVRDSLSSLDGPDRFIRLRIAMNNPQ